MQVLQIQRSVGIAQTPNQAISSIFCSEQCAKDSCQEIDHSELAKYAVFHLTGPLWQWEEL